MDNVSLADNWRAVQGQGDWQGMLDPLDGNLRNEIIRYGQFIQTIYDSFDNDAHSKYAGSSRYGKSSLFDKVHFKAGYTISRFLYATAQVANGPSGVILKSLAGDGWSAETNWFGYIAVADDEEKLRLGRRDIVVVLRGTLRRMEWVDDFQVELLTIPPAEEPMDIRNYVPSSSSINKESVCGCWPETLNFPSFSSPQTVQQDVRVAEGWLMIYNGVDPSHELGKTSAREQVHSEIRRLIELHKDEQLSITIVGHSLGASLAVLCAFDIANSSVNAREVNPKQLEDVVPVTAFAYGTPGVGNIAFKERAEELKDTKGLRILRVSNVIDVISRYPGSLLGYEHAGSELVIDSRLSPMLKKSSFPGDWHNLQVHLHVVAGTKGIEGGFEIVAEHDYALVNKSADCLVDELLIPGAWWQLLNKGLVMDDLGKWRMPPRPPQDVPSLDNPEFN